MRSCSEGTFLVAESVRSAMAANAGMSHEEQRLMQVPTLDVQRLCDSQRKLRCPTKSRFCSCGLLAVHQCRSTCAPSLFRLGPCFAQIDSIFKALSVSSEEDVARLYTFLKASSLLQLHHAAWSTERRRRSCFDSFMYTVSQAGVDQATGNDVMVHPNDCMARLTRFVHEQQVTPCIV